MALGLGPRCHPSPVRSSEGARVSAGPDVTARCPGPSRGRSVSGVWWWWGSLGLPPSSLRDAAVRPRAACALGRVVGRPVVGPRCGCGGPLGPWGAPPPPPRCQPPCKHARLALGSTRPAVPPSPTWLILMNVEYNCHHCEHVIWYLPCTRPFYKHYTHGARHSDSAPCSSSFVHLVCAGQKTVRR